VPRNGSYQQDWQLTANDGEPISLVGSELKMDIRPVAGQGDVIASASIDIHDAANGTFTVQIDGADFDAVPGETELVRLAYDLRHTFEDGVQHIYPRGQIQLMPGVTF